MKITWHCLFLWALWFRHFDLSVVHNYEMIQSLEIILDTRKFPSKWQISHFLYTKCVQTERQCSVVARISKNMREKSRYNINLGSNSIVCGALINQNKLKLQHILIYTEIARLRYHSRPSIKYVHSAVLFKYWLSLCDARAQISNNGKFSRSIWLCRARSDASTALTADVSKSWSLLVFFSPVIVWTLEITWRKICYVLDGNVLSSR